MAWPGQTQPLTAIGGGLTIGANLTPLAAGVAVTGATENGTGWQTAMSSCHALGKTKSPISMPSSLPRCAITDLNGASTKPLASLITRLRELDAVTVATGSGTLGLDGDINLGAHASTAAAR